jgi:hypothetical protein
MLQVSAYQPVFADELHDAAAADDHEASFPTHVVLKDGKIVGCASVFGTPFVDIWLHTKEVRPKDTLSVLRDLEEKVRSQNIGAVVVPVPPHSPLLHLLTPERGYRRVGEFIHFEKVINL